MAGSGKALVGATPFVTGGGAAFPRGVVTIGGVAMTVGGIQVTVNA